MQLKKEHLRRPTESKKERLHRLTDRRSKLIIGVVACILLVAAPFMFYAYRLIPVEMTETTILGITIKAGAHQSLNYYAYYTFTKLVFLILFILWFLTCRYWWKHAILVPICMLIFQILGLVNTSIGYIDEFDFWYSVPVVIPMAALLIVISRKLRFYSKGLDLKEAIEKEINEQI